MSTAMFWAGRVVAMMSGIDRSKAGFRRRTRVGSVLENSGMAGERWIIAGAKPLIGWNIGGNGAETFWAFGTPIQQGGLERSQEG